MPSTYTTSLFDSIFGGMGQMSQNRAVFLRKVRPSPGISLCVCLLNSHLKKISSCFVVLSIFGVIVIEQLLQRHLCEPADVLPYLVQIFPQEGHITCLITPSSRLSFFKEDISKENPCIARVFPLCYQHFLSDLYLVSNNLKPPITLVYLDNRRFKPTHFVL